VSELPGAPFQGFEDEIFVPIKGLIFDLDGVLVDTVPTHFAAWSRMFHEYGYEFGKREYRELVDGRLRLDGARAVMHEADDHTIEEAATKKNSYYLEAIDRGEYRIFNTAVRCVREYAKQGYKLAAASSSANVRHILDQVGILEEFTIVVGGQDVVLGKPNPEIFLKAAKGLGLQPEECIVVEDAESGVKAAKAGGFYCYGLAHEDDEADLSMADEIIRSLDEINLSLIA
jgi:beta-phosphoglucomutase